MTGQNIAVLGGGAWGTALASAMGRSGSSAHLWVRDHAVATEINRQCRNSRYLADIELGPALVASTRIEEVLDGARAILAVVPAQHMRQVLTNLDVSLPASVPLVLCAKGIERETGLLMSQVAQSELPQTPVAALSGPSFASDVARGLPTAVTVAAGDDDVAGELAHLLSSDTLRCYSTDDLIGVEVGGALKNVLAIAAGAVDGAGLGASAVAALITRGFVELRKIGRAMGAREETMMGLSGLGDLILTCSSGQSRNYTYGLALGRGEELTGLKLAEGAATAEIAAEIAKGQGIDAPIVDATARLIAGDLSVPQAVRELFARPLKSEDA